jgi:hypothetical protein
MSTANLEALRTVDGHPFKVIATNLPGPLPTVIFVEGHGSFSLDADNKCPANAGMSLITEPRRVVRFFNVYRAADGGFVLGSRAFVSNAERVSMRDTARAIAGCRITFDDTTGAITAERV